MSPRQFSAAYSSSWTLLVFVQTIPNGLVADKRTISLA